MLDNGKYINYSQITTFNLSKVEKVLQGLRKSVLTIAVFNFLLAKERGLFKAKKEMFASIFDIDESVNKTSVEYENATESNCHHFYLIIYQRTFVQLYIGQN